MTRLLLFSLAFVLTLVLGILLGRTHSNRVLPKVHELKVADSHDVIVESVPDVDFPETVKAFHSPAVSLDFWVTVGADGKINEISSPFNVSYMVSVPTVQHYISFPSKVSRQSVAQVRNALVDSMTAQIRGIHFKPRLVNGQPVSSSIQVFAKFILWDAYEPRSFAGSSAGCDQIELEIFSDGQTVWRGNTSVHREEGCFTY